MLKIKYSTPILPVIRFDSGMIIFESLSDVAFKKHSYPSLPNRSLLARSALCPWAAGAMPIVFLQSGVSWEWFWCRLEAALRALFLRSDCIGVAIRL